MTPPAVARPRTVLVGIFALLSGCGGGSVDLGPGPQSLPIVIDGAVLKGPVADAHVCARWLGAATAAVDADRPACVATGADGAFRLEVPRAAGLLQLEASGGSYPDEAAPGTRRRLSRLRTVVAFEGPETGRDVPVTALTELAVRRAETRGTVDAAAVAAAFAEVGQAFGVSRPDRARPADVTAPQANLQDYPSLSYGLANAGILGWMAERGLPNDGPGGLDDALAELSGRLGAGTLHGELAAFRAGMRRVIAANPASGLNANAAGWAAAVALDFGRPPPAPVRPPIVEQPGTLRFAVRWELTDLLGGAAPVCITNVPASTPQAAILSAAEATSARYGQRVTGIAPVEACLGAGQSVTVDFPTGTEVWGDEG
jgi:hypothetical protein